MTLALGACTTVGPDYRLPDKAAINAPAARGAFVGARFTDHADGDLPNPWWRLYDDQQLNRLVEEAFAANADLRVAAANLARSEAIVQEAEGAQDIKAGASATAVRAREAGEAYIIPHALPVENLANAGIRLSYQIDLVGGLRRAAEAAEADAEASRAALDLARISIAADVTQAYAEACSAGHELTVAEQAADLQQKNLEAVT
ncbi:MAG TPA: TolC family protein, partial [Methyloversatilis sp.]